MFSYLTSIDGPLKWYLNQGIFDSFGVESDKNWLRFCFVCHKSREKSVRSGNKERLWAINHGEYGNYGANFIFHIDCLEMVLGWPEEYSREVLDFALKCDELISHINSIKKEQKTAKEKRYLNLLKKAYNRK